jgi:hypothetical protein
VLMMDSWQVLVLEGIFNDGAFCAWIWELMIQVEIVIGEC